MKKVILTICAVAFVAMASNAQDNQSEKFYGSHEGGYAITFNANPVLNYVGNMFNGTTNNSIAPFEGVDGNSLFGGVTITGKYFLKNNINIVAGFGFNNNYNVMNNFDLTEVEQINDFNRTATTAFQCLIGGEYRLQPGKRLQPIFGASLVYMHTNSWSYTKYLEGSSAGNTSYVGSPTNTLGLMFNAGVEYFVTPQISFGANLDFAIAKIWEHSSLNRDPEVSGSPNYSRVDARTTYIQTGNLGANITLNFYF